MNLEEALDAEHAAALRATPKDLMDLRDIPVARRRFAALFDEIMSDLPSVEGVTTEDHQVPGHSGSPDVPVRLYRPMGTTGPLPTLLWFHGGGLVMGDVAQDDFGCSLYARDLGCAVASVEYRLAPENPFPAPLDDGYAALAWLATTASGVDSDRIAVGGASSGAGLAAAPALLARDRGAFKIIYQLLIYPMLDDRNLTPSSQAVTDRRTWNREANLICWDAYLGGATGSDGVSEYAAPSRAQDLSGLPPAYIGVGGLDLFRDEDIDYARRLQESGVATDLHVYAGAFHGSDNIVPTNPISQRQIVDRSQALAYAFDQALP